MRKSWNGLYGLVSSASHNFSEESIFVFFGKSKKQVKIFYWDGNGFCIWMKKLEKGIFPFSSDGKEEIKRKELHWLLSGIDFRKRHTPVIFSG